MRATYNRPKMQKKIFSMMWNNCPDDRHFWDYCCEVEERFYRKHHVSVHLRRDYGIRYLKAMKAKNPNDPRLKGLI